MKGSTPHGRGPGNPPASEPERRDSREFPVDGPSRRDFLKLAGFSLAGATLFGCTREPVEKAIPLLIQPEEVVPGQSTWYASTCGGCEAACGVLVKCRDGRPIKLEGNPGHPLSRGGLCAAGQASVLELYDSTRLDGPTAGGRSTTWAEVDSEVAAALASIQVHGGAVRVLTGSAIGPTAQRVLDRFLGRFADGRHVVYDALSAAAILDAHERTHHRRVLPRYRFERADAILGIDADFLGTWISPVEYTAGWAAGRRAEGARPRFSHHTQLESVLSVTGAKADERHRIHPDDVGPILSHLVAAIGRHAGRAPFAPPAEPCGLAPEVIATIAARLWESRRRALVVCGTNDGGAQVLVNALNDLLESYGETVDLAAPSFQRRGGDQEIEELVQEIEAERVAALFIWGANPVYDLPDGKALAAALEGLPVVVDFARRPTETAACAHFVCPDHHFLESWSDAEPVAGLASVTQPAIRPLRGSRSALESLAVWMGDPASALDLVRRTWEEKTPPLQAAAGFEAFWKQALWDGYMTLAVPAIAPAFDAGAVQPIPRPARAPSALALVLYPAVGMRDGRHGHNPWLHEMPDPITKLTWGNAASFSPATARQLGIAAGDVVRITARDPRAAAAPRPALELPAHVQPGQADGVVAVALGYGVAGTDRFTDLGHWWRWGRPTVEPGQTVGRNAAPLKRFAAGRLSSAGLEIEVARTGARAEMASTQDHHDITVPERLAAPGAERRPIVQETTLAGLASSPAGAAGDTEEMPSLWPADHEYTGARWGMVIDLTACTGCAACVVACQIENNVPVVGRDEVLRSREMHWMRIDRYYGHTGDGAVEVLHQPMLCQHCGNAPCETVCPVLATAHSSEGLNTQVYNRCVGTRYCANNCPYKVRRFNWFEYRRGSAGMESLVLNPDVTMRSRGVMEKCSFCVQRIQDVKAEARSQGRPVRDGEIMTACQQSCPAQAIVFGDANDPQSAVSKLRQDRRHYRVLAELNVEPAVGYLKLVRNRPAATGGGPHHG